MLPTTPLGWPPLNPPQLTAWVPPSASAAPTSPPTSAWPELDGSPSAHAPTFQITAEASAIAITRFAADGIDRHDSTDRVGDRGAEQQRPEQVEDRREHDRLLGARAARRHQSSDRVRGVVEAVRYRERRGERDGDDEARIHAVTLRSSASPGARRLETPDVTRAHAACATGSPRRQTSL